MECHIKFKDFYKATLLKGWKAFFPDSSSLLIVLYNYSRLFLVKTRFIFCPLCKHGVSKIQKEHLIDVHPRGAQWDAAINFSVSVKSLPLIFENDIKAISMSFIKRKCSLPDYFLGNRRHTYLLRAAGALPHHHSLRRKHHLLLIWHNFGLEQNRDPLYSICVIHYMDNTRWIYLFCTHWSM